MDGDTNKKKKSGGRVRFAPSAALEDEERGADDSDAITGEGRHGLKTKKRPRNRPNEDELDDIDEWNEEDDTEGGDDAIPSQQKLLQLKRQRRLKQRDQYDDDEEDDGKDEEIYSLRHDTEQGRQNSKDGQGGDNAISIEPFNMEQEKNDGSGYFDGDTYIFRRNKDDGEPDAWLDSLNENDGQRTTSKSTDDDSNEESNDELTNPMDEWKPEALYAKILPFVSDTETITQAIVRYGNIIKRNKGEKKKKKNDANGDTSGKSNDDEKNASTSMAQQALNDLTEASNALLLQGHVDIYQKTRTDLLKLLPSTTTIATQQKGDIPVKWEYQGSQDGKIHGPYTTQEMMGWIKAGYFVGPSAVKIRTVRPKTKQQEGSEAKEQLSSAELQNDMLSDLMDDDDDDGKKSSVDELVKGEWLMSDQVDFSKYG